jgi:hypothetical protein
VARIDATTSALAISLALPRRAVLLAFERQPRLILHADAGTLGEKFTVKI